MPLDRTGEPIEDDDEVDRPHRCRNGWIDRDADHPVPCLVCKPHLARVIEEREEASAGG